MDQTSDLSRLHHDKRKVLEDDRIDDLIQPKRICHPTEREGTWKRKPWTLNARRKIEGIKRLERKDCRPSSSSVSNEDDNNLAKILSDIKPEEIEKLRQTLEDGNLEIRFNWIFWNLMNSTYGTLLGYVVGFLVVIVRNHTWMLEEFALEEEGHSVSKTLVILFIIYGYSFITLGFEAAQLMYLVAKLYYPNFCIQLGEEWREHREYIQSKRILEKWRSSKYFITPFAVLWCIFTAFVGSEVWVWFWWNHICKSYHDRTCRKSWIGKLVRAYRDQACYDGTASSAICEKFVSYFPIMVFCVAFVFIGNVLLPLINDWLSMYYPISPKLEAAFDIMHNLNQVSEKEESPTGNFTFTKTFSLDDAGEEINSPSKVTENNDNDRCSSSSCSDDDEQFEEMDSKVDEFLETDTTELI